MRIVNKSPLAKVRELFVKPAPGGEWYYYFDRDALIRMAERLHYGFTHASPFSHVVIDGLFSERALDHVLTEYPAPDAPMWIHHHSRHDDKLESGTEHSLGPFTRHFIHQLNGATFIEFLQVLTGIAGLIPDPHLYGAGLHQIYAGGFLGVHADFSSHPITRLSRRLNVLLYLNRDWKSEWGGDLELYNADLTQCQARIAPLYNRLVIFTTHRTSYHGHPRPLTPPDGITRKSLALYFYTNGRPGDYGPDHETLWQQVT